MNEILEIVDIRWERVILTFDVKMDAVEDVSFFLRSQRNLDQEPLLLHSTKVAEGRFELTINVTQFQNRRQVPNGTWLVCAETGGNEFVAQFDLSRIEELEERSRAFLYNGNFSSYTVTFGISDDETSPDFLMRTYAFGRSNRPQKRSWLQKNKAKARKRWTRTKRKVLRKIFQAGVSARKGKETRILFASEARPNMQGNLKAVHDRLVERGLDKDFEFRYSFRTLHSTSRLSAFYLGWQLGRSDIVLIDDYFAILKDISDTTSQRIIQLWHAGSGFKTIGYSRFGQYGSPHLTNSHRMYSYAIAGSQHLRDVYSEAFGIEREAVIATGLPRIDNFLREGRVDEVRPGFEADFPAAVGKRKILFAPTFRGHGAGDAHYPYEHIDFEALYEACGEHSVVLFRQHHFVPDPAPIPSHLRDRLIDVSSFPDTNDLLLLTDVLITDYSSIIYEFALLRRPMLFFAFDLDLYSATRGMHRDYREVAPGDIATDFSTLLDLLREPNLSIDKAQAFLDENFDYIDTKNSDRVIDQLILSDPKINQGE
ncbi:CDP-glycerol glycerophosphotransferase family protein [Leucobacter salsicius]|uniref:CDP-glycerol glycerophosphotransferase family protein n=1 Tax=Leucobacter salsicius TaxID=664638 RepID=UPI000361E284|nr:CDP-glycerol glycerophosphotransferase family protein [Leucobacter salsicius]